MMYVYSILFSRSSLINGILTVTLPVTLIITQPLTGVVVYSTAGLPTFPTGIKITGTNPYSFTVNIGDCPEGTHTFKLLYIK